MSFTDTDTRCISTRGYCGLLPTKHSEDFCLKTFRFVEVVGDELLAQLGNWSDCSSNRAENLTPLRLVEDFSVCM